MATQQLKRNQVQAKTWEAIFPNEQLTEQKSALFVKKLLAVAISSVTYLRAVFPEHAYGDKCLEDLNLKILRDESSCPGACQVIKWVKGCFDALDKKYLKTLIVAIYMDPNDPETVMETYTFKFTYKNNGEIEIYRNESKISSAHSVDETKKATIRLLRTIVILTSNLDSLPDNAMMTMKLFYYDDVTPNDYEPPGFKAASSDDFAFTEETTNIAVGDVSTLFHSLKLRVKTSSKQFHYQDDDAINETDAQEISNTCLDDEITSMSQPVQEISTEIPCDPQEDIARMKSDNEPKIPSPAKTTSDEKQEYIVRCPCGCNEDDGLMVLCSQCNFWQHGICFLITDEKKAPSVHICDICSKLETIDTQPTDPCLKDMSSIAVQATCLWRRTLSACLEFKRIMAPQLARRLGIEVTVAQGLMNRLEKEGFLLQKNKGKRLGKTVEKDKIQTEGVPRYLKTPISLIKKLNVVATNAPEPDEMETSTDALIEIHKKKNAKAVKKNDQMGIDTLVEKTTNINIQEQKRITGNSPTSSTTSNHIKRESRKRAYSRIDTSEFEVSNSQDNGRTRAKKKASTTAKNIKI